MNNKITPRKAKWNEGHLLARDNVSLKGAWILFNGDGTIVIANQRAGESPTGKVILTRRQFNAFVDWYNGKQQASTGGEHA